MRTATAWCLALGVWSATAHAEDAPAACKAFIDAQWQELGSGSEMSCLKGLEQWIPDYNSQGFRFGLWGQTLLSADRYYFYRSVDGGRSWQPVGLKSDLAAATQHAAELPGPAAQAVVAAVEQDAAAVAPEPQPAQQAQAPVPADRRSCSVRVGDDWQLTAKLTLSECADRLDQSPDQYDRNGYKYAYWSGVFLTANDRELMQSPDSHTWTRVRERAPR